MLWWQVTEPWQWLGLDVRGPLPQTLNGHKYILSVTDYFSKWVEAVPMESCLPSYVVKHIVDIISHFGYPLRILSRLPHDIVHKVSELLFERLTLFKCRVWVRKSACCHTVCFFVNVSRSTESWKIILKSPSLLLSIISRQAPQIWSHSSWLTGLC